MKLLPNTPCEPPQSCEQMVELPAWLGLPQTQPPLPAHPFPFPLRGKQIPAGTPSCCISSLAVVPRRDSHPWLLPDAHPVPFPSPPGYGQDLSGFGQGFSDPSQQPPPYGGPSVQPSSGPPAGGSGFGRGQNHNVQGFHPYRR